MINACSVAVALLVLGFVGYAAHIFTMTAIHKFGMVYEVRSCCYSRQCKFLGWRLYSGVWEPAIVWLDTNEEIVGRWTTAGIVASAAGDWRK